MRCESGVWKHSRSLDITRNPQTSTFPKRPFLPLFLPLPSSLLPHSHPTMHLF